MSADNFNYVQKRGDLWIVWLNLSASCETPPQIERKPDGTFHDRHLAVEWADAQGYTEYGTRIDEGQGATSRADLERALVEVALAWARVDRNYAATVAKYGHATPELEAASREVDAADKQYFAAARDLLAAVEADQP